MSSFSNHCSVPWAQRAGAFSRWKINGCWRSSKIYPTNVSRFWSSVSMYALVVTVWSKSTSSPTPWYPMHAQTITKTQLSPYTRVRHTGRYHSPTSPGLVWLLDRKLAFTSMLGSDWHTSKQKVYDWPSNKSDLRPHHDRLASSRPSHAIRKSIGKNAGPRTTTMARPPWYTCDWPSTNLWCFASD